MSATSSWTIRPWPTTDDPPSLPLWPAREVEADHAAGRIEPDAHVIDAYEVPSDLIKLPFPRIRQRVGAVEVAHQSERAEEFCVVSRRMY